MTLGIALGGGGAKGLCHIGILKAFDEAGIKFDAVAGTSIGAIVGGFYAAGKLNVVEEQFSKLRLIDLPKLFGPVLPSQSFFSGKKILELFRNLAGELNIEDLDTRFAAVSTDIHSGDPVVFTSGNLSLAIRASLAIPGIFSPVAFADKLLVDGGVVDPVPVGTVRKLGADRIVAVDLFQNTASSPLLAPELRQQRHSKSLNMMREFWQSISLKLPVERVVAEGHERLSIIDITERTLAINQRLLSAYMYRDCAPTAMVAPPLAKVRSMDFHHAASIIKVGYDYMKELMPKIRTQLCG